MKLSLKRLFSLLMVLVMVGSMLPAVYADSAPAAEPVDDVIVLTDEDYAIVNDVFAQIDAMEDAPAKKGASETQLTDAAAQIVMASENYVEDSLERNGNFFTWWTDEGIRCVYSPRMREIQDNMVAPEEPVADGVYNEPVATKGGWPSGNQVYLIGPYYGSDSSFTDQYKNEAKAIAAAIGDTDGYTLYSGTAATVDKVAEAVSNGAVVIFDSHGTTDYENGNDYVTGAQYSYLCLETNKGMTNADYNDGALYGSGYAYINGATIANHMTKQSPAGIVWMAICLGMATDTLCEPMREMGVEVVYGYSQSVTFEGDYRFETTFWDNMTAGKDVATSIAAMKSKWGNWDWSTQIANDYGSYDGYSSISAARSDYSAFPIVVSDEDVHPGQRKGTSNYGADSLQTVKSTYTLFSQYNVTVQVNNRDYGSATANGNTITAAPATGYFAESAQVINGTATVTQNGNIFSVQAESDCTVQINFAPKTTVTVNFSGANVSGQTGYAGDSMQLPTATAPEGYTFLGWTTEPLSSETTEKPSYYTDSFIPAGNTTLYALYSYVDAASGGGSGDYVKVTESRDDWSGEYVIVYEDGGYIFDGSLTSFDSVSNYQTVTITDDTIAAVDADAYKFTIAAMNGGYSIQGASGKFIGHSSNANALTTSDSALKNTISMDASGNVNIVCAGGAYLRFNKTSNQYRFRYYKSSSYSNQQPIALYIKDGSAGTTYYVSTLCDHPSTSPVDAVAATCTEAGYTAGTQCTECGSYVSGHEVVAALGHSWSDWAETTAPKCETAGEEARTCGTCGETQTQTVTATGHSFGDWVVTTDPTCTAEGEKTRTCGNCGTTETEVVDVLDHSYGEGNVTTAATCTTAGVMTYTCSVCVNTTTEVIPALGHNYSEGVCTVCGEAEPENTGARYYIAAERSDTYFYMTSDLGTASTKRYQAVDSGLSVLPESITEPEDGYVFILTDNGDGTYSLQAEGIEDLNYLGHVSGNSGLLVDADSALKLTVEVTNGVHSIHFKASDAERYLSLNATAGNDYFAWYKTGQISNLVLIPVGGTTTDPSEPTEPGATEPEATEPAGSATGVQMVTDPSADVAYKLYLEQTTLGQTLYFAGTVGNKDYYLATTEDVNAATDVYLESVDGGYYLYFMDGSTKTYIDMYQSGTYYNLRLSTSPSAVYTYDSTYNTLIALNGDINCFIGTHSSYNTMSCCKETYLSSNDISHLGLPAGSTVEPEPEEPTEPEVTEPEVTEPEVTAPAGSVTSLQYVFSDYAAGTQYAQDENHTLDDVVTLTINGAHLNTQIRLYAGSNAVFTSTKVIDSIIVKAGYKADTLNVYGSTDGKTWELIKAQATTTRYTDYSFDMSEAYTYVKLESVNAQIRVSEMTINVVEPGEVNPVKKWNLTLGDSIGVNFYMELAETDEVTVTVDGKAADVSKTENADGTYKITVEVAAAQMTDEIVISVNGKAMEKTYSVRAYADVLLADENQNESHTLVKNMLVYGGAAQTYFEYKTDDLASKGITVDTAVPTGADEIAVTDNLSSIAFYGASLVHRTRTAVRFYFVGSVDGLTFTVGNTTYTPVLKDGMYYIEVADINPQALGTALTVTVSDAANSLIVGYSPLNYIVRMYEKQESSNATKALAQALYGYYAAAADYQQ